MLKHVGKRGYSCRSIAWIFYVLTEAIVSIRQSKAVLFALTGKTTNVGPPTVSRCTSYTIPNPQSYVHILPLCL
ncbi:hypothetical protein ACHQM5_002438 [Ranunculus cassubicifolius]